MIQLQKFHINFVKRMMFFISLSTLIVISGLVIMSTRGFNYGTDFKGGIKLTYRFESDGKPISEGDLRHLIDPLKVGDFSVQKIGAPEDSRFTIKVEKPREEEKTHAMAQEISAHFKSGLKAKNITLEREETVGPKAGHDLRKKALLAILVSSLLMLIYIGYRFDFSFAPGAIIALFHDLIITLCAFSISGREISLTVVAALLTIKGYSVNDTIVIFDRIRENIPKMKKSNLPEIVNASINETLSRTIITNLTVFIVVVLIFLFGEGEFQNFGFAMIVGAISGTYSTIFVASPIYIFLKEYGPRFEALLKRNP